MLTEVCLSAWLLACLGTVSGETEETKLERHRHGHEFDVLILTQHWPYTTCMEWEERKGGCRKIERARWSVHGLWPTKLGHISPNFCNNSWSFDHTLLRPIKANLTVFWPDVEIRPHKPDSLWQHEWQKHGTCAAQLPSMDSELKYFSKGVELAQENPVTEWLHSRGILPNKAGRQFQMREVWEALLEGTQGMRPHVDCEEIEGEVFIREIKVCYSKQLQRVHCDGIIAPRDYEASGSMMGTCMKYPSFLYPASTVLPHNMGWTPFLQASLQQQDTAALSDPDNTTTTSSTTTTSTTSSTTSSSTTSSTTTTASSTTTRTTSTSTARTTTTTTVKPGHERSGLIAGVVCSILALLAVGVAVGYIVWRRGRRSHRGYESL